MAAAFRPRFRRGAADDGIEPGRAEDVDDDGGDDGADGETGEWLAYEFHEWSLESRVMLAQLLTADKVVHSWQGTTLMVHESLEQTVDSLVEEVEETERAKEAISRPIGPEDELTAFELGEWPEALRAELMERLVQARVPHILDTGGGDAGGGDAGGGDAGGGDAGGGDAGGGDAGGHAGGHADAGGAAGGDSDIGADDAEDDPDAAGEASHETEVCDLLVREVDEERVELVIDDLLAREEEASFEELDGLEVNDLLSGLFMACDRLRRDPSDADGMRGVAVHARRVAGVRTPFGFSATNWRSLRNAAGELLGLVEGEDTEADELRELAHRLSDTLRMLI